MPAWLIPALISGASALGGLFGKKSSTNTTTNVDRTTMPQYDPKQLDFRNNIMDKYGYLLNDNGDFDNAYRTTGLKSILKNSETLQNSVGDVMSSRGIGRTGAGGSGMLDTSYGVSKDISDFLLKSVMDQDSRRQQILNSAASFSSSIPTGSHVTGTESTTATQEQGGGLSGLMSGLAAGLSGVLGTQYANDQLQKTLKSLPSSNQNIIQTASPNYSPSYESYNPVYNPINPIMGPSSGSGLKGIYNPFTHQFE